MAQSQEAERTGAGNVMVIIGVIAIIVIAALAYYYGGTAENVPPENQNQETAEPNGQAALSETLNQDAISDINEAIDGIDLGNIDEDMKDIDEQLKGL